jgi:hypothetical protein
MHITAKCAKTILINILNNLPEERQELLEETQIAKPELLLESSQPLAVLEPEQHKRKRRKLHFLILCLILRMIFLLNLEIPQIIM